MWSFLKQFFEQRIGSKIIPIDGLKGLEKSDAIFHNLVIENKVPGLSVTILQEGKVALQKGYGTIDLESKISIDPQKTLFRIASISKCITGLAFGKMVEDGLLHWDDSLFKYVPEYPKKQFDFTLRQLANHTAGIRGYRGKEFALNQPYSIKDSLKVFQDDPLQFEPGKGYLYNSFDFVLLSLAMERAAGTSFETYVQEKVLLPFGMENTIAERISIRNKAEVTERSRSDRASIKSTNYTKSISGFQKAVPVNNYYKLAGGGYLSTSADIAKMGHALLHKELLDRKTYQEILFNYPVKNHPIYYGLGFQVSQDTSGRPYFGHVGNSVGAYTNFYVYPEQGTVISILINCTDPKVQNDLDIAIQSIWK
ncbi:MAG: serine hydrolase domain-containing protein [Bacteroidota bacterium]